MSHTESINKKDSLDSAVIKATDIVRLASEHAKVCESFRKALEDNGIGPSKANPQQKETPHTRSNQGVNVTKTVLESSNVS